MCMWGCIRLQGRARTRHSALDPIQLQPLGCEKSLVGLRWIDPPRLGPFLGWSAGTYLTTESFELPAALLSTLWNSWCDDDVLLPALPKAWHLCAERPHDHGKEPAAQDMHVLTPRVRRLMDFAWSKGTNQSETCMPLRKFVAPYMWEPPNLILF